MTKQMTKDLKNLMLAYSRRGMAEWTRAEASLKTLAVQCLCNSVAEGSYDVNWTVGGRNAEPKFLPMPRHGRRGFEWCFFMPKKVGGELSSLILFVLIDREKNSLAFRLECSSRGSHEYSHLQLTSKLERLGVVGWREGTEQSGGVPKWLPDSYPAFPIPARNWTEMFLAMMTAVHGHRGGVDCLIQDIFREENRTQDVRKYIDLLDKMLSKLN